MTDSSKRPAAGGSTDQASDTRKASSSPTGTPRAGRRRTQRHHQAQQTTLQKYRTPLVAVAVIALVAGVSLFVFSSASSPAYACTTTDTVQTPAQGEIGQVQPDMGNQHVGAGEKVTYPVCPPASGKHVNRPGFGPLKPNVYGPDDASVPNGWVHNLEHGGLVLLYSCDKGACDAAALEALQAFSDGFPNSAICAIPAGVVGPVVARFEQMPTRYAALVWDRVLYLDTLDAQQINDFFLKYAERVGDDGSWIAPPEPQCAAPSPSPDASPSAAPSESAVPAASPSESTTPAASPSVEPSPSAS